MTEPPITPTVQYGHNFLTVLWHMRQERKTFGQCALKLNITRNQVAGICWRQGWCVRKPEPAPPRPRFEFPDPGVCFWPIGQPRDVGFHFCGGEPVAGKPYCATHSAIAFMVPKDKSQAA